MASLRQIAKELGITPAYLSYIVNGKQPFREDLYERYCRLVNTPVNDESQSVNNQVADLGLTDTKSGVPGRIRTRDPLLRRQPLYPLSYWDS
jgi:hypothetical protein